MKLPEPVCEMGYSSTQVKVIMGSRLEKFNQWMRGSTTSLCDGRRYNYDTGEYEPTGCGPHGMITYRVDVEAFLWGFTPGKPRP